MEKLDLGRFGQMSGDEILSKLEELDGGYKNLQKEFTPKSQRLAQLEAQMQDYQGYVDTVNLINELGLGEQVAGMVMQAQRGYTPQPGGYDAPNDPHTLALMAKVDELEQKLSKVDEIDNRYWTDRTQTEIQKFRSTNKDLSDEDFNKVGQFMIERRLPSLDDAYYIMNRDDFMEKARLDGENRVKEQLRGGRPEGESSSIPVLGGGEGGLQPEVANSVPTSWKGALKAAIDSEIGREE